MKHNVGLAVENILTLSMGKYKKVCSFANKKSHLKATAPLYLLQEIDQGYSERQSE